MIAKHDIKGDGVLSFDEFKQIFIDEKDRSVNDFPDDQDYDGVGVDDVDK